MLINEQYSAPALLEEAEHTYIGRDGTRYKETEEILREHAIDVYVNEILTMKLICLPEHLTELVLGRLLTEGIISRAADVVHIYICEYGKRAKVLLHENITSRKTDSNGADYVDTTHSCCTGNRILNDFLVNKKEPLPVVPINWKQEWIFQLADAFAEGMPLHKKTFATHSCFLMRNGEILFSCEDIGRHNALDKSIGFALRNNIPLKECIIYSSGRIPTDMALKAIYAGIPVLASKASPTAEAVKLAKQYGLTLICAARKDRMKLF